MSVCRRRYRELMFTLGRIHQVDYFRERAEHYEADNETLMDNVLELTAEVADARANEKIARSLLKLRTGGDIDEAVMPLPGNVTRLR